MVYITLEKEHKYSRIVCEGLRNLRIKTGNKRLKPTIFMIYVTPVLV